MSTFATRLADCGVGPTGRVKAAELARQAQVSAATVSDWLGGKTGADNIKAAPLLRAAAFLEVNPMWLLTGKGRREATAATVLTVEESLGKYSNWPFERVPPEKYYALPHHLQIGIQLMLDGVMLGVTMPIKSTGTNG